MESAFGRLGDVLGLLGHMLGHLGTFGGGDGDSLATISSAWGHMWEVLREVLMLSGNRGGSMRQGNRKYNNT